jgi:hypothetical protein
LVVGNDHPDLSRRVVARYLAKGAQEPADVEPDPDPEVERELRRARAAVVRYVMGVGMARKP